MVVWALSGTLRIEPLTVPIHQISVRTDTQNINCRADTQLLYNNSADIIDSIHYIIEALIWVESSNNDSAYCKKENAVGCLQIRPCMVKDINRILKTINYKLEDRWNRTSSIEMLKIYINHYNLHSYEDIARCWNGGPKGMKKTVTLSYWNRVELSLNRVKDL